MSLFVSFEGGEGTGKSTQVDLLAQRLQGVDTHVVAVREPGTTPLGTDIRAWLKQERLEGETISDEAELLLFAAARAEMVFKVLVPALREPGTVVVADRYADSTTAYQGYGRRRDLEQVAAINRIAADGTMPDLTILLDCEPEDGLKRVRSSPLPLDPGKQSKATRVDPKGTRRFELEPMEFHRRVRAGYLKMAEQEPDRWRVLDATGSVEGVAEEVWRHVSERLPSE